MPNLVSLTCPSLQNVKRKRWYFQFLNFCSIHINKNCHNFRTSHDIVMKLGSVTTIDKRNTATLNKFDNDVISTNCDVIVIFPIYGQFGVIRKPDSGRMISKTYIFITSIIVTFHPIKTESRPKKSPTELSYYCLQ